LSIVIIEGCEDSCIVHNVILEKTQIENTHQTYFTFKSTTMVWFDRKYTTG